MPSRVPSTDPPPANFAEALTGRCFPAACSQNEMSASDWTPGSNPATTSLPILPLTLNVDVPPTFSVASVLGFWMLESTLQMPWFGSSTAAGS